MEVLGKRRLHRPKTGARPRRVAVVTGTRAEYGLLRSPMEAIAAHPNLTLQTVVAGMHLLRKFGSTVRQIERHGWRVDARVPMQRGDDHPLDQATGLARGVRAIAAFLERAHTDIVLVLGDRIEAMAGALAATATGRWIAHIHGGDVAPGDAGDALRHSITKLAQIHLAASKDAARRLVRMGERPESVHVVGAPGLDHLTAIARNGHPLRGGGSLRGGGCPRPHSSMALVVQHASGRGPVVEGRVMSAVLRAVQDRGLTPLVIYPNTDRGHSGIIAAIERARACRNGGRAIRTVRSMDRDAYLRALLEARVLVGNSSSGIIEAPAVGTPCVNIGRRQAGRLRAGPSVIDSGESYSAIRRALGVALKQRPRIRSSTLYGDGRAGARIADILARARLSDDLRRKVITF